MEKLSESMKKIVLAGIGAVATTAEKSKEESLRPSRGKREQTLSWRRTDTRPAPAPGIPPGR